MHSHSPFSLNLPLYEHKNDPRIYLTDIISTFSSNVQIISRMGVKVYTICGMYNMIENHLKSVTVQIKLLVWYDFRVSMYGPETE